MSKLIGTRLVVVQIVMTIKLWKLKKKTE